MSLSALVSGNVSDVTTWRTQPTFPQRYPRSARGGLRAYQLEELGERYRRAKSSPISGASLARELGVGRMYLPYRYPSLWRKVVNAYQAHLRARRKAHLQDLRQRSRAAIQSLRKARRKVSTHNVKLMLKLAFRDPEVDQLIDQEVRRFKD